MDNRFEPLATGEVLSIDESALFLIGHRTFRVGELAEALRMQLEYGISGWSQEKDAWFNEDGISCEVLRFTAQGWQKGRVRINLEFCPQQDFQEQNKHASASFDDKNELPVAAPASIEHELDLVEPPISSASFDNELALESPSLMEDELDLGEPSSLMEDELDLGTPVVSSLEQEPEAPTAIYVEMEQEAPTFIPDDQLYMTDTQTSLDDEFDLGEISESIEQELELVEAPAAGDDELLDLGSMSAQGDDDLDFGSMSVQSDDDLDFGSMSVQSDDDLDFGSMSDNSEDEFNFGDISLNDDLEDSESDSLLDDVWQDMNQASWQNKQH